MASPISTAASGSGPESKVLDRLCVLYQNELRIYEHVLELTRRQAAAVRRGEGMEVLQGLLMEKKHQLELISALEEENAGVKIVWERRRHTVGSEQASLQRLLRQAGNRIEEILGIEAEIDRMLIDGAAV